MALELDPTTLNAVVEEACRKAAADGRWLMAIGRAAYELEVNPFVERNPNGHGLIIGSTSGQCYSANGTCSCTAYTYGQPCYHRAMARLVRLHDEREAAQQVVCSQPDNICEVHNPCPEHAEAAAAYLTQEARPTIAKMIAAARAKVEMDELFA